MRIALTLLLMLLAAVAGWYVGTQNVGQPFVELESDESSQPQEQNPRVRGIGELEPHSGVLQIMAPMGQRIESVYDLKIGDTIQRGQPIVKLAGTEKAEMELLVAEARYADAEKKESLEKSQGRLQKQAAEIALQEARSRRQELESQAKGIVLLNAQLTTANDLLGRLQNLKGNPATQKLVGTAEIDKQRLVVQQLETKIEQSQDEIRLAEEKIERAEQAALLDLKRVEKLLNETALPENSLDAAIAAARKALEMMEIKSPIDGAILDIVVRPGDTATNRPVMIVGDTSRMVCVAEINDSSLAKVSLGAKASISSTALPDPLKGKVISKGIMIGSPSLQDPNPFASVDRKTGRVLIELENSEVAGKFVNLQVDVSIETVGNVR